MLEFERIRWRNFLSTGNQWTEVQLNRHRTTLIVGKNGAGKSTLLDAVTYALFGKPFRRINKPQLHNSITRKGLLVECELKINGVPYVIKRGDRPGIFEVWQDGVLLNQNAKNTEYQETLEKQIIKCNFKSFCQIVILGSATYQPFMALPAGNRREIIEDLLDLQVFTIMNKLLIQKANENNSTINQTDTKKQMSSQKLKLMRKHVAEMQSNVDQLIEEKRDQIASTEAQIDATGHQIEDLFTEINNLSQSIADQASIAKKIRSLEELRTKISSKIHTISKEVGFFHDYDNCPTCQQAIDADFKTTTIADRTSKISDTQRGLDQLEQEYAKTSKRMQEISAVQMEVTDRNLELKVLNTKISGWHEYVHQLDAEINNLKKSSKQVDTSELETVQKEIVAYGDTLTELHETKQLYQVCGLLLKDGGIKSKIVRQYVPIINKLINKYLSIMDFFVNFELNESFEETIKSRHRDEFSFGSFSEGEKMRINLAILFTWRAVSKLRNSINTNLLIMDEVLDGSIDTDAKDAFFQILGTMSDTNVFVISHMGDSLFEKFDSVIKFEKSKNFSRMVD
jgi:DNA repair exonuclease SbcCD ATPase subunit